MGVRCRAGGGESMYLTSGLARLHRFRRISRLLVCNGKSRMYLK